MQQLLKPSFGKFTRRSVSVYNMDQVFVSFGVISTLTIVENNVAIVEALI